MEPLEGAAQTYAVSPHGKDTNPGTLGAPFATLTRARDAIRELKASGRLPASGATVWLREGTYPLTGSIQLDKRDSGKATAPIAYQAYPGETARLTGGQPIPPSAWRPVDDQEVLERLDEAARARVVQVDLTALGINEFGAAWPARFKGYASWMELFFDGEPMSLARWPNEGYAEVERVIEAGSRPRFDEGPDRPGTFQYKGDRPRRWSKAREVYLNGYWHVKWYDECIRVDSIDTEKREIAFAAPHHYGLGGPSGGYYFALNLLEELDAPGEYFVDRERGILYFWPPAPVGDSELAVSILDQPLVCMEDVSHVTLRDLVFEVTRGKAVEIQGGRDNLVRGCTVRNVADDAIVVDGGQHHGVVGCEICGVGKGGIVLSGGDRASLTLAGHFATDNHIHHYARIERTYKPAITLQGAGCRAAHNLIHDAPHEAISFNGNEHTIELNEIHHVCTETDDAGAIYTGRDWTERGNVIRHNYLHHIGGGNHVGVQAIYLDDMACGATVFGNIIFEVQRAFLIGGGRDIAIENNVIVNCEKSIWLDARGLGWMKFHVEEGGILPERLRAMPVENELWRRRYPHLADILDDEPGAPKYNVVRNNLIVRSGAVKIAKEARRYGVVRGNRVTRKDPGFVDTSSSGLGRREDAPVWSKLPGFARIPVEQIGPREEYERGD